MMRQFARSIAAVGAALMATSSLAAADAAAPVQVAAAGTPSPQAVKAALDATKAARTVTFHLEHGNGSIALARIGRTRTRVRIAIPQGGNYKFLLYPGSVCGNNREMAASAIALTPMNTAGINAAPSETIVSVPIESLSQNYVVEVRNNNTNAQVASACAHLSP